MNTKLTHKEVFSRLKKDVKLQINFECIKAGYGAVKGYKYSHICTVYKAPHRVRREWNEPHSFKEVDFEVNDGIKGYFSVTSFDLDKADISAIENGFVVVDCFDPMSGMPLWKVEYIFLN